MAPRERAAYATDTGTPELARHSKLVAEQTMGRGYAVRVRNVSVTALDRAYHAGLITDRQFSAGEKLLDQLWRAQLTGSRAANYQPSPKVRDHGYISHRKSAALAEIKRTFDYLDACQRVGIEGRKRLVDFLLDGVDVREVAIRSDLRGYASPLPVQSDDYVHGNIPRLALDELGDLPPLPARGHALSHSARDEFFAGSSDRD